MRAILTFHSIDDSGSVLSYPPKTFRKLLDALERCDIPILHLDTLLQPDTPRGVALTFDDGMRTVFTEALPILRSHSSPAHLFLTTGVVGTTNRWPSQPPTAPLFKMLRWSEIEALQRAGMRIEAHTVSHPDLRQLADTELRDECESAEEAIASRLGVRPRYFAYPYGFYDSRVRAIARKRYNGSFTTKLDYVGPSAELDALPRLDAHYLRSPNLARALPSKRAHSYIALRRALRRLRGH